MIKSCKYCGAKFDAKTTWQEYCKDSHRVADYRRQQAAELKRLREQEQQRQNSATRDA